MKPRWRDRLASLLLSLSSALAALAYRLAQERDDEEPHQLEAGEPPDGNSSFHEDVLMDEVLTDEARSMLAPPAPPLADPEPPKPLAGSIEERIARVSSKL